MRQTVVIMLSLRVGQAAPFRASRSAPVRVLAKPVVVSTSSSSYLSGMKLGFKEDGVCL